jgi:LacI family transcriptional regulator
MREAGTTSPRRRREGEAAGTPRVAVLVEATTGSARGQLRGIAAYLREHGLRWAIDHEPRRLSAGPPAWLARWRGDGIIARVHSPKTMAAIERLGVPVVDLWGQRWAAAVPRAACDEPAVARLAAEHLCERGFRRFAFVGVAGMGWSAARAAAFARAVEQRGGTCDQFEFRRSLVAGPPSPGHSARLRDWLMGLPRPLGVMAVNDFHAAAVAMACTQAGLAVPEEVAIVGVDNDLPICELASPPLSSVAVDHEAVGHAAARLLERLLAGEAVAQEPVSVPPLGVVARQSTACLAVEDALVTAALRLIRDTAAGPLSIDDLAGELDVSRAWLTRAFAAHVGHGIHEEIVRVRLQEARRLLTETDLKLDVVARRTGFEHPEHLGRVFRRKLGLTPGAYRRQRGQKPRHFAGEE